MEPLRPPLLELRNLGQSVWVDDLRRAWLTDGTVKDWIGRDGISGITSNPAILGKSIAQGEEYRADVAEFGARGLAPLQIYEALALEDVRTAADLFAPVYQASGCRDGFVSLEVSPLLADDTAGTVLEARRLWQALDRPNVMIKVPATEAGLPAIVELIASAINVNVTLVFGLRRYGQVVDAFLAGLERRVARMQPLNAVASVASVFISRIDTAIDARLDELTTPAAQALRGGGAIACARLAYEMFNEWIAGERWQLLRARGGAPQRLLWASTSTKDAAYAELKYVEALIAPQTINTLPRATLDAWRDHGRAAPRLQADPEHSRAHLRALRQLGIEIEDVAARLEREGVRKFVESFERLLAAIAQQLS